MHERHLYYKQTRTSIAVFGSVFTDLKIARMNEDGTIDSLIPLPVRFSKGDRWFREIDFEDGVNPYATTKPSLTYSLEDGVYDSVRKKFNNSTPDIVDLDEDIAYTLKTGVPYNLRFSATFHTDRLTDALQFLEQTLPYFEPNYTVEIRNHYIPDSTFQIPITLESFNVMDDGDVTDDERTVEVDMDFTMQWTYFGPKDEQASHLIKTIDVHMLSLENDEYGEIIKITPETTTIENV